MAEIKNALTCLCCISCASSVCTRSTSNTTGKASMTTDVPMIHNDDLVNLYTAFAPFNDDVKAVLAALLTKSGNISDNPIIRSVKVLKSPRAQGSDTGRAWLQRPAPGPAFV